MRHDVVTERKNVVVNTVLDARPRLAVLVKPTNSAHNLLVVLLRVGMHLPDRPRVNSLSDIRPRAAWVLLDDIQESVMLVFGPDTTHYGTAGYV